MTPRFLPESRRFAEALLALAATLVLAASARAEEAPPASTTNADAAKIKPAEPPPLKGRSPARPAAPARPAREAKPAREERPTSDAKPAEANPATATVAQAKATEAKPATPAKAAEAAKPAETSKPAEAAKPAEPAKPADATKPAEAAKPAPAAKSADAAKPAATNADAAKTADPPRPTPAPSTPEAEAVWKSYEKRWSETEDYSAGFRQIIEVPDVGSRVESAGRFYFAKPGLVRWEYTEGPPQTVVGDGTWIWLYQPDLEQVYKIPYAKAFGRGGLVELLAGREGVSERYRATLERPDQASVRILLKPLQEGTGDLEVTLEADSFDIREVVVHDAAGSTTKMTFAEPRRNHGIDKARFTFTPPAAVDIISESEAGF